jgi:hypothetical protein
VRPRPARVEKGVLSVFLPPSNPHAGRSLRLLSPWIHQSPSRYSTHALRLGLQDHQPSHRLSSLRAASRSSKPVPLASQPENTPSLSSLPPHPLSPSSFDFAIGNTWSTAAAGSGDRSTDRLNCSPDFPAQREPDTQTPRSALAPCHDAPQRAGGGYGEPADNDRRC